MAYQLKTYLADKRNYGSKRTTSKIKYLVLHYTANDGDTDESESRFFRNNVSKTSAHYFVDDDSVTQSVPDNYVAWSVGGSKYTNCKSTGGGSMYKVITNTNSISIEICDTIRDGSYNFSAKTKENLLAFCKVIMLKYGIDINHVYRHFDVTGKSCPAYFVDNNKWAAFKKELLAVVTESSNKKIDTAVTGGTYNQQMFIADVCKILGAFSAKEALAKTVTISESNHKNHALVTPLERYMKALGYYTGSIEADSGKKPSFGPGMTKAIKKYQTYVVKFSQTKNIDGVITAGNTTWKKLLGLK